MSIAQNVFTLPFLKELVYTTLFRIIISGECTRNHADQKPHKGCQNSVWHLLMLLFVSAKVQLFGN